MIVFVVGAHGATGQLIVELLATHGHTARGMARNPAQLPAITHHGGQPVLCDLEAEHEIPVAGANAVIFAAGAGTDSGPARKETVDYGGAVKLMAAARKHNISRYVMLSGMGAADPTADPDASESLRAYRIAKARADEQLRQSGLAYTIVRPGRLTNEPATGLVDAAESLGRRGEISRADVAQTLIACLEIDHTVGKTFELLAGKTTIDTALWLV